MDKVERVYRALNIEEPDKLPKGELQTHDELVYVLLNKPVNDNFEAHVAVRNMLQMDLVNLGLEGGPKIQLVGNTEEGILYFEIGWATSG